MHTTQYARRRGVGRAMLLHIIAYARIGSGSHHPLSSNPPRPAAICEIYRGRGDAPGV